VTIPGLKLLDRLILGDLMPKLLASIATFSAVFLITGPILAASRFEAAGIPWWIIAEFVGWDFTAFIRYTFPMGMLLAALLGFDRLSRDSEAVALFAGGISFGRIMVPVIGLGLLVSFIGYLFNDRIASYALQRSNAISEHRQDLLGETSKPFDFATRKDGKLTATVHVEQGYDAQAKAMRRVTVTEYGADGRPVQIYYAARATPHGTGFRSWTGQDVEVASLMPLGGLAHVNQLELGEKINKTPENIAFLQRDPDTLNFHDLQRQITELRLGGGDSADIRNAEVNLWFKVSLPFSCLIFGLVGAPLGLRSPRSAKISGFVWALPILLGYYVIFTTMQNIATGGGVSPILAAWLPNIIGLLVGSGLIWKASV